LRLPLLAEGFLAPIVSGLTRGALQSWPNSERQLALA